MTCVTQVGATQASLIQAQLAAQCRQVFGQSVNRANQCLAVVILDLVVGFKTAIFGFVLGQDLVDRGKVLVDLIGKVFVIGCNLRTEQVENLLRAVYVALEVIQVGMAVTVFFAGNLGAPATG